MNNGTYFECLPGELNYIIWSDVIKSNKINSNNCHLWKEFLTEELVDYVYKTGVIHQINEFRNLGIAHFVSVKKFCDKQQKTNSGININNFIVPLYKKSHYPSLVSNKEHYHMFRNRNYDYLYMLYSLVFNQHQCPTHAAADRDGIERVLFH